MSDEKVELNIAKASAAGMAALFQRLTGKPLSKEAQEKIHKALGR
jgi:hypothetical protein